MALWNRSRTKREPYSELDKQQEEFDRFMLQTINHMRHDWMNDLQVLFGYIQMKKVDNLQQYVEKIKQKMKYESALSKLGVPWLIAYLFSFRANSKVMRLDVELDNDIYLDQLPLHADDAAFLIREVIELCKASAEEGMMENILSIQMEQEESSLLLDFVYQGEYDQIALYKELQETIAAANSTSEVVIDQMELLKNEAVIALRLPYRNT